MIQFLTNLLDLPLVKFGLVGGVATLSHYITMFVGLVVWDVPVFWSFVGACVGAVVGYVLNYHFTFQSDLEHTKIIGKYVLSVIFLILMNTFVFFLLSDLVGVQILLAQLITTGIVFFLNYAIQKYVTFKGHADIS